GRAAGRGGHSDPDALDRRSCYPRRPLLPLHRHLSQPEAHSAARPADLGRRRHGRERCPRARLRRRLDCEWSPHTHLHPRGIAWLPSAAGGTWRTFEGVPMFRELHVAPDTRQAEAEMKDAFRALCESYARWGQPGERYDLDFDELKEERILVGSPVEIAERVNEYRDEFSVPFMWFRIYYPGMDPQLALETIRLFGEEVIPLCRPTAQALAEVVAT